MGVTNDFIQILDGIVPVIILPDKIISVLSDHCDNDSGIVPPIVLLATLNSIMFVQDVPNDVDNVPVILLLSTMNVFIDGVDVMNTSGIVPLNALPDNSIVCNCDNSTKSTGSRPCIALRGN